MIILWRLINELFKITDYLITRLLEIIRKMDHSQHCPDTVMVPVQARVALRSESTDEGLENGYKKLCSASNCTSARWSYKAIKCLGVDVVKYCGWRARKPEIIFHKE